MPETTISIRITPEARGLAEVPPELEWFQNLRNERTRTAYKLDIQDFMDFIGLNAPKSFASSPARTSSPGVMTPSAVSSR
jgi:hypothetical protein